MKWLDVITDTMDINLSNLWEMVRDREAWCATVHGVTEVGHELTFIDCLLYFVSFTFLVNIGQLYFFPKCHFCLWYMHWCPKKAFLMILKMSEIGTFSCFICKTLVYFRY